ncbi:MAG: GGDEF domain-containing protein [Erysipelotrichaceae bacterium]|nr:GGDEF domain-containing protein [Erysipelotrichaceae bacterium]
MELFRDFLIHNFFLFCLTLAVIFMVLRSYRSKRIFVMIPIMVVSLSLLLSLIYFFEQLCRPYDNLVFLSTLFCSLGFIIRPLVLYLFMRMTIDKKPILITAWVLMSINMVIYLLALLLFAPELTHVIFYYEGGEAILGPLFYTCHIIISIMVAYFVVYSIYSLKGRHKYDALACLICGIFVGIAVILESLKLAEYLLNTTVAISCLFYVVHLYQQASIRDALTNLFDRRAYYYDVSKMESKVSGVIFIDVNSLKWINDNQGHLEGDNAIKTVARIIYDSLNYRHMDAYRMGGDEFAVLITSTNEADIDKTVNAIKNGVSKSPYTAAVGYAKRTSPNQSVDELAKEAEKMMYEDKSNYYKTAGIDRRKA